MKRIVIVIVLFSSISSHGQSEKQSKYVPYAAFYAGGCDETNPFQFMGGVQKQLAKHISIGYDVLFWKTKYESYCDERYSKGEYTSITPAVKLITNSGKEEGRGLMVGVGIGYVFAKDRGVEQSYKTDPLTGNNKLGGELVQGKWDFNSLSPSFDLGVGFRIAHFPVSIHSGYYFAKTTEGWMPVAGGVGLKFGFRKIAQGF
jgi:hypothetical protein